MAGLAIIKHNRSAEYNKATYYHIPYAKHGEEGPFPPADTVLHNNSSFLYFCLLSSSGAKKIGVTVGKGVYAYYGLLRTHLPRLSNLTTP
jgi:hypothetical protein